MAIRARSRRRRVASGGQTGPAGLGEWARRACLCLCTMILAQLGARVIKVEMPGTGDDSRAYGPFANGKSLYFSALNYDKQSIALNLKQAPDREIFDGLVGIADVLVEN